MRHRLFIAGLVLLTGCVVLSSTHPPSDQPIVAPPPPAPAPSTSGAPAEELTRLLNAHRRQVGCPLLAWHDAAARAAQAHSADMARRSYFDHVSPEGRGPDARLAAEGASFSQLAENIGMTFRGPADVVRLWLTSPAHRGNLENCAFTHHGVGASGAYYTHVLLVPR